MPLLTHHIDAISEENGLDLEDEYKELDTYDRMVRARNLRASYEIEMPCGTLPLDALNLFFQDIKNFPLLKLEEERFLTKKLFMCYQRIRKNIGAVLSVMKSLPVSEENRLLVQEMIRLKYKTGLDAKALNRIEAIITAVLSSITENTENNGCLTAHLNEIRNARKILEPIKTELVNQNMRLSIAIAKKYTGKGLDLLELIQEGNEGLMKAAERFDPTKRHGKRKDPLKVKQLDRAKHHRNRRKPYKFSTYAVWWVRQKIMRALGDQSRTIRVPIHMVEVGGRVAKVAQNLSHSLGHEPSTEEIAAHGRFLATKVKEVLNIFQPCISLDQMIEVGADQLRILQDHKTPTPLERVETINRNKKLDDLLRSVLTPREYWVIKMRFSEESPFLREIGEEYNFRGVGVTPQRINQIEKNAFEKLRNPSVKKQLLDFVDFPVAM